MFKNFNISLQLKIIIILLIIFIVVFTFLYNSIWREREYFPAQNTKKSMPETVVVLHGIAKTNRITYLLSKRISNAGFNVYNITYPSTQYTIQELADFLNNKFQELGIDKLKKINIVGHSMGGLITRAYINKYKPKNLSRVVMIGTPNHGSELTDKFKNLFIYKMKFGTKAGRQLGADLEGLDNAFGTVNYDLGIIAGKTWINPIFSAILKGDDDGIVSVESTKLDGMKEHIVINFPHTVGIHFKNVSDNTIKYLKNGSFK